MINVHALQNLNMLSNLHGILNIIYYVTVDEGHNEKIDRDPLKSRKVVINGHGYVHIGF